MYDAREDHAPVLALVGQVPSTNMNYDYFQESSELPMFSDVAVYNRVVMTPESLPYVVDKAIREAYKNNGVLLSCQNNFGLCSEIPDVDYASHTAEKKLPLPQATDTEVDQFLELVKEAKRPIFHVGSGIGDKAHLLVELSQKITNSDCCRGSRKGENPRGPLKRI